MLVRGHQAVAFRTAFTITGDAAEAEDAAQDAFVKVYRTLTFPFRRPFQAVAPDRGRQRGKKPSQGGGPAVGPHAPGGGARISNRPPFAGDDRRGARAKGRAARGDRKAS